MKIKALCSPPIKNGTQPDFSSQRNFRRGFDNSFISEKMALFIMSRIAHLENRLEDDASRFRKGAKGFLESLLNGKRKVSIGCINADVPKDFTVTPYIVVESSDPEDSKQKRMEKLSEIWVRFARKDLEFLKKMKVKFFQDLPVSTLEQKELLMIKECGMFSRYFDRID